MKTKKKKTSLWMAVGAAACGVAAVGCGKSMPAKEPASGVVMTSTAATSWRQPGGDGVVISEALRASCRLPSNDDTPRFAFDSAALKPEGRGALQQLARCLTEGPLRGARIALVGHADPRGEDEYNMALGGYRADAVANYLGALGVPSEQLGVSSRGEIDARGSDPAGWAQDRRVDVSLEPRS